MPIIANSTYPGPPLYEWNKHLQTILPAMLFQPDPAPYERERLTLTDGDFVDLDWLDARSRSLIILSHGLEGNSRRPYMQRAAHFFYQSGWDVLAWNCRSCSGEMNRKLRLYFHGEIDDFRQVIEHALQRKDYERVVLAGYSMGGSILMKYLGVYGATAPDVIRCGIAFSTPWDLESSADTLEYRGNGFYKRRFLRSLGEKMRVKAKKFPGAIDIRRLEEVKVWKDFDRFFSVPLNGFSSTEELYHAGSAGNFASGIRVPALLVNALNDPILGPGCYPYEQCRQNRYVTLETPRNGGHVGFNWRRRHPVSWMEHRAMEFARQHS